MFENAIISQLKQSNISIDGEKTKQRVQEVWKGSKPAQKKAVAELAGVAVNTVYRVIATGSLSAKIAAALGQVLNANPFYLTGDVDENSDCSDELIVELLKKHKYTKLLAEHKKSQKKTKRNATQGETENNNETAAAEIKENFDEGVKAAVRKSKDDALDKKSDDESSKADAPSILAMTEDDILLLIRSLKLKAGMGVQSAVDDLKKIDGVLLV